MAGHFKMALIFAALAAAAIARRDNRAEKSDDMEREEISRRQWQYDGPIQQQEARRSRGRSEDSRRRRNVSEDPQRRKREPKEPRMSRHEPEEPQIMRGEKDHRHRRDESEAPQRSRDVSEYLRRRRDKERHRRSRHTAEEPGSGRDKTDQRRRDALKDPRREESEESLSKRDESEEPQRGRLEPKEPGINMDKAMNVGGRSRNEIEDTSRSKPPKTTEGPFGSDTTTTETSTSTDTLATAASEPAPMLPPLSRRYRRIYNADEMAKIEDHPYLAAVLMNNELWCGGAIISSDMVFTAAHCLQLQYNNRFFREYVKMLTVRVGSSNATAGGEHLRVDEIFFHPNYKPQTLEFNYAVLRLHKNISLDVPNVARIEYSKRRDVPIDKNITFLGWGSVLGMGDKGGAVLLQKVDLPVYDKADCVDIYGRDLVTTSNFCAGYISKMKNVCNHDAGGPAIMDAQLVGILSFSSKRCDEPDRPAVFSSAGAAAEWLETIPDIRRKSDELQQGWMNLANDVQ